MAVHYLEFEQKAQLSARDPHDALYQLKCCSTVVKNNAKRSPVSLRNTTATATFYSTTCIVLYTHRSTITHEYATNRVDCHSVQVKIIFIHPS